MRRRRVLAAVAAAIPAGLAGCTEPLATDAPGGADESATTPSSSTATTARTTTRAPCSRGVDVDVSIERPEDLAASAEYVVRQAESPVAAAHFDPDGGFDSFTLDVTTEATDFGARVEGTVDVHFEKTGDGPNATTAHVHLRYRVEYRVTDRRVVRVSAGEGPTGTVVCW